METMTHFHAIFTFLCCTTYRSYFQGLLDLFYTRMIEYGKSPPKNVKVHSLCWHSIYSKFYTYTISISSIDSFIIYYSLIRLSSYLFFAVLRLLYRHTYLFLVILLLYFIYIYFVILLLYFILGLMHYTRKHWNIINTNGAINYLLTCLLTFSLGIIEFMIQLSRYQLLIKFKAKFIYIEMKFFIKWELNLVKRLTS